MSATARPSTPHARALLLVANKGILAFARRWLAITNTLSALLAGLPLLAAWLAAHDLTGPAQIIFGAYSPLCQQRPGHSFFPWGAQMAVCQREFAIYASLLVFGLAFALVRHRARPARWWVVGLLIAPMALDGFSQLFGWRQSTPELRLITGSLFGLASVWLLYPFLESGFSEMIATIEARFRRLGRG